MSDGKKGGLSSTFNTVVKWGFAAFVAGLVIDMLWIFPIVHNSVIGSTITGWSTDIVVPFVDSIADAFGFIDPAGGFAEGVDGVGNAMDGLSLDAIPEIVG